MSNATEGLSPLAAYEELMHFAKRRGEFALRLAMHAAVPQGFQPELLHLLKRNFVPEAGDDPALEADILFSPLCEELGRGFFSFDPQVRSLLLENLAWNYAAEPESRIAKVADFLLAYVDHYDRSISAAHDQLWRDYLEMQRWVAFAFVDPAGAAQQLAAALENASESDDFVARIQLGGLASALAAPLAGFSSLLNYAAGLQALELGDREKARELLESLEEDELKVGNTTLRSVSQILKDWHMRHPEYGVSVGETELRPTSSIETTLQALQSNNAIVRRRAVKSLGRVDVPEQAVQALIASLEDPNIKVRLMSVNALARIKSELAVIGLAIAVGNSNAEVSGRASWWLGEMRRKLVLVLGHIALPEVSDAIQITVMRYGHLPVFLETFQFTERRIFKIAQGVEYVIVDVTHPDYSRPDFLEVILQLSIPVQPISHGGTRVPAMFADLQERYPLLMRTIVFDTASTLRVMLDRSISSLFTKTSEREAKPEKFEYDIFISYAREDSEAVAILVRLLTQRLAMIMGRQPNTFLDADRLEPGMMFEDRISDAINKSAVFIVFSSPAYFRSEWCLAELKRIANLLSRDNSRIFKVETYSARLDEQPTILKYLPGYRFIDLKKADPLRGAESDLRDIYALDELAQRIAHIRRVQSGQLETSPSRQVLIVYEHKDQKFRDDLSTHLKSLLRQGLVDSIRELVIAPGFESYAQIKERLDSANVILLLMSPDFLASDFVLNGKEMEQVRRRAEAGGVLLIPIIVRAVDWRNSPYERFQALPGDALPIESWFNADEAYAYITREIQKAIETFSQRRQGSSVDRWPVRTGTDEDVDKVYPEQVSTTVEELVAHPRPRDLSSNASRYQSRRAGPEEFTTWLVVAKVTSFGRLRDGTYRLTLSGDSGVTMLAHVPDPKFVEPSSPWRDSFIAVRSKLVSKLKFGGTFEPLERPIPAQLIGIGYFGRAYAPFDAARNGIELHPIIAFEWMLDEESASTD